MLPKIISTIFFVAFVRVPRKEKIAEEYGELFLWAGA